MEELYANEFEQLTPDDEFLLGQDDAANGNDTKIPTNDYFDNNNEREFRYAPQPPIERTRIGLSDEDMV